MAKRKPFRTYLSFLCMHMALGIEPGDFDDLDESEHIIVTYH